uniref:Uncharacterized protein n=1 Tax=uncultured marine virus TaxID=186617 RepID=A0A0F7L5I4_9VIRU|nr:hypothetical protein [uncultured marine virus]
MTDSGNPRVRLRPRAVRPLLRPARCAADVDGARALRGDRCAGVARLRNGHHHRALGNHRQRGCGHRVRQPSDLRLDPGCYGLAGV